MREPYVTPENLHWKQARRTAFIQDIVAAFTQHPEGLLSFKHVSQKLRLGTVQYLDLQDIPVAQIAGSVQRYTDFTRAFFPRGDHLQHRWQRIDQMIAAGRSLPPIELYKIGQVYFVRDGHHRVSVARQRGIITMRAHVWEYETPIPLQPDSDVDELLCRLAQSAFLEHTNIDHLCPDIDIRLTHADGYEDLLHEIQAFQQILSKIDQREIPFSEAVTLWSELRYAPIVAIIRERYVLEDFPGRTETDLYIWLCHNQRDLQKSYEYPVLMEEAADDLSERFGEGNLPVRQFKSTIAQMVDAVAKRVTSWWRAFQKSPRKNG